MFCCGGRKNKIGLQLEDERDDSSTNIPPSPRNFESLQSLHDYVYSPKDFCDTVMQKKLVPEFYLSEKGGLNSSQDSIEGSSKKRSTNGLPRSQSLRGSPSIRASQGLFGSHGSLQSGIGASDDTLLINPADLQISESVDTSINSLRVSQGDSKTPMTPKRGARYSSFFSDTSYTNINYYEEFCALFPHFAIVPMDGYRVELGGRVIAVEQELFLQEQDAHNLAYQKIFQKNDHNNFVGGAPDNPFIISILVCDDVDAAGCRCIVRTKFRDHHLIVPNQNPPIKMARYALVQVRKFDSGIPSEKDKKLNIHRLEGPSIIKDLSNFEEKAYKSKHKMGILYCKGGQTTEEEMFCNTEPSYEFNYFLDMLATRVPLKGFPANQFNGGLDTKADLTGTESYYTTYEGVEIMFHVSTLLPFNPDKGVIQIERKKHIGNDVVCIVFMDSPTPFKPNTIVSKFTHVLIVVQFLERNSNDIPIYRVSVASKPGVEPHQPVLPTPPHLEGGQDFRRFLLTKAINSERAAIHAPAFKLARTRMNSLATIIEKYVEEEPPKSCFG